MNGKSVQRAPPRAAADTNSHMALSAARRHRKSLASFVFATIVIYASLSVLTEEPPEQSYRHSRSLLGEPGEVQAPSNQPDTTSNDHADLFARAPAAPPKPYSIHDVLSTRSIYKSQFGVVVYSPPQLQAQVQSQASFTLLYPSRSKWKAGCHKLIRAFEALSTTLVDAFNDNATSSSSGHELVLAISAGDSPPIHYTECVVSDRYPCFGETLSSAPVLHFGSSFANPVVPGEIAMPMPQHDQLGCFQQWAHSKTLCPAHARRDWYGREWEDLIPQVVWRGTDFTYLGKMRRSLRAPDLERDVPLTTTGAAEAVSSMKRIFDELIPRWKGVVLTAEAEYDAARASSSPNEAVLPWANLKFSHYMHQGKKTPTSEGAYYLAFESSGIPAVGECMSLETLSRYKYHIDLGGGGGTTWSGTLEKLALPGLLFHHVTPTKDYFHDSLKAWEHYVPIKEDLSDLKDKFEWAEANGDEARKIAERSTEWVRRWFASEEGFGVAFDKFYREPLKAVLDAYEHVDNWKEVLEREGNDLKPIMTCSGVYGKECEQLDPSLDYHVNHGV